MTVQTCAHGYQRGYCPRCDGPKDVPICGPTHHLACACRESAVAKLVERVAKARAMLQHSGNSPHCSSCAAANEIDAALDEFHGRKQG